MATTDSEVLIADLPELQAGNLQDDDVLVAERTAAREPDAALRTKKLSLAALKTKILSWLGNSATRNIGTGTNDVPAGDHIHDQYLPAVGRGFFSVDATGNVTGHNLSATNCFFFPGSDLLMYATPAAGDAGNAYTFAAANGVDLRQIRVSSVVAASFIRANQIRVSNSVLATSPGSVARKMEIFDGSGVSLGFIAIYDSII